jgi:hypothetical protein
VGRSKMIVAALAVALLTGCAQDPEPDAQITLAEMAIGAPADLSAGTNVWEVTNFGDTHHNLSVCRGEAGACDGENLEQRVLRKDDSARDPDSLPDETDALVLGSGWTNLVEIDLEPGRYRLWCGVPNHVPKGMELVVDVR